MMMVLIGINGHATTTVAGSVLCSVVLDNPEVGMRRRDLLRTVGWVGLMSAVPMTGCAAGGKETAPEPASISVSGSPSLSTHRPSTPTSTSASAITPAPAAAPGGRLVHADVKREPSPPAALARHRLLPFSAALYKAALTGQGNAVLSPYSVVSALGMLALGARGVTATKLAGALGGDAATVARWVGGADAALARAVTTSKQTWDGGPAADSTVVEPANVLFLRQDAAVRAAYLTALARGYGTGVRQIDFADREVARSAINGWVAQRTRNLIPQLLPVGFLDARTLLVLVNALYLKAAWANPFDPGTTDQQFSTLSDGKIAVRLMTRSDKMNFATGANWQAVSIPLVYNLAMTVIVPDAGSFAAVSNGLNAGLLTAATSGQVRQVDLALPAFRTDTPTDLVEPLRALGLGSLFDRPDLSGIARAPGSLFVSGAVHQARIVVDDKGIEAAAATAVAVAVSGAAPAELRVDRPFLYLIHDVETVTPLFLGRVTNPTA